MRYHGGSKLVCAATIALLSGCATTGALHRAQEEQQEALASERVQRINADSALRVELAQQLGEVRGDIVALRNELKAMRTDFGAKIAAIENGLQFMMPVNFGYNNATVRPEDVPVLTRFSAIVSKYYPGSKVTIEGFADPAGSARYNVALSERRAISVRDYLMTKGLTNNQLNVVGYGKTRLVTPGAWGDAPGAEQNRRVVFVIETRPVKSVALAAPPAAAPAKAPAATPANK
jgi:peptidoglycan-associated lipoprotein